MGSVVVFPKDQLDSHIGFLVSDIARQMTTEYNRVMEPIFGLTRSQFRVIIQLLRQDGQTQSQLATVLQVGKVSVGGIVDRLEYSGWVERRPDPSDRRSNLVYLTEKGRSAQDKMIEIGRGLTRQTLKGLTKEERDQLVDLLLVVKRNLQSIEDVKDTSIRLITNK